MKKTRRQSLTAAAYLAPAVILMLLFFIWPLILTIFYSFTNLALTGSAAKSFQIIGLENFKKMLTDKSILRSMQQTLIFLLASVFGQTVLGFGIAWLMRSASAHIRKICGAIILTAYIMPEMVAAVCCYSFFSDKGTLNEIIIAFGASKISWLFTYPMLSISLANIWRGSAFSMMVYQAALDGISSDVEENAMIDGCSRLQNIRYIILPQISPTFAMNTLMISLATIGCFGMIYAMTGGGPGDKTQTMALLMYNKAFKNYQLGYASAISVVLLVIGLILSIMYIGFMRKNEEGF